MSKKVTVACVECNRPIELQKRSLTRYMKRNNTDEYVCASCTASRIGQRPVGTKERQERSARAQALWSRRDYREKVRVAHRQVTSQTEFRKAVSANNKKRWANEQYRAQMEEMANDPNYKAKIAKKSKKNWEDEAYRKRVLESKNQVDDEVKE